MLAWCALTCRRVYKDALSHEQARTLILAERARHFDPDVIDAFLKAEQQFIALCVRMRDDPTPVAETAASTAASANRSGAAPAPCNILVVDDSPILLRATAELLRSTGQSIFVAHNAAEAMKVFTTTHPGVVVSDWEMPGDSGVDLCRQMRKADLARHVHFLMLTVHSDHPSLLEAYSAGVDDFVAKPFNPQELLARVRVGIRSHQLRDELQRKTEAQLALNTQLAVVNSRLDRLSITDELTGLFNRRHAMVRLEEQWSLAERYQRPIAVAMIDIDHFKQINDSFGHDAGDLVLCQIAGILRDQTRAGDLVCRVGGEEFLVIFPAQTPEQAVACAQRCCAAVANHGFQSDNAAINVTVSIGVAAAAPGMYHFPDLLRIADKALFAAKDAGRNRVQLAIPVGPAATESVTLKIASEPHPPSPDYDVIVRRCGGDPQFAASVIDQFREQAPIELKRLDNAIDAGDTEPFRIAAHSLRSMTAYVSAEYAAELSRELEDLARADRLADAASLLDQLHKEIQRLINEEMNLGFSKGVQVTVIREAGPFDQGPFIPLRKGGI